MPKMVILRGLPACGKSTRSQEIMAASGNTVRVNKDLLRTMLHADKFTGRLEGITHQTARLIVSTLLQTQNVIIDDTNLNPGVWKGWKDLATSLDMAHETIDMTDVPVEECVRRDAHRGRLGQRSVGYTVICNMALRYGLKTFEPGSVVLCDLDGTIADIRHRLPHVRRTDDLPKDWKAFFAGIPQDTVREDVRDQLRMCEAQGKRVIFLSARPETHKAETVAWLEANNLPHFTLIMRASGDHRDDALVKIDMLNTFFPDRSVIHCIFDDRPRVIRAWREHNLNVIDVGAGVEF